MNDTVHARDRLMDAALALTAAGGWRRLSMADIARQAGVPLVEAYDAFPSKLALLEGLVGRTDRAMLAGGPVDPEESARDRLFDLIMRRFDALQPDKEAFAVLVRELPGDPLAAVGLLAAVSNALTWVLEAAGLPASGAAGALRRKGLAVIYLYALRTWLDDDSPDMAKTMAALDRGLRRAESLIRSCPGRSGNAASAPATAPHGTPPAADIGPDGTAGEAPA